MGTDIVNTPRRRRGCKPLCVIDLASQDAQEYRNFVFTKGWSKSTGLRREKALGVYTVPGIPGKLIIPSRAEAVLRNEPLPRTQLRRGRGRPPKGAAR
jgi:hypothetical protein